MIDRVSTATLASVETKPHAITLPLLDVQRRVPT